MKKNILKTVAVGMAACALVACSNGTNNAGAREEQQQLQQQVQLKALKLLPRRSA